LDVRALFEPRTPDDFPRLERLFEKSKRDFWNDSTIIDWDRPLELPEPLRRPLARILSVIYYGERCALEVASQLLGMVDDEQAKFALSAQVVEEAKHVTVFRRLLSKLDEIHPVNMWSKMVLLDLVRTRNKAAKLIGMQLIVENFANHLFHHLRNAIPDPQVREVLYYVEKDEAKHTGLAAIYLPKVLEELRPHEIPLLKARQLWWLLLLTKVVYDHREDAEILGIDLHDAMQRGIESQNRIIERVGMTRGLWQSKWVERITLAQFRRLQQRTNRSGSL